MRSIAAAVEQAMTVSDSSASMTKQERLGKAAEQGAANVLVDHGKLEWRSYARPRRQPPRGTWAQPGILVLVPVLCGDQLGAGAWGEDSRMHLRAALLKFGLQSRTGDALASVLVGGGKAAIELGLLLHGQWKVVVIQAVPKLGD